MSNAIDFSGQIWATSMMFGFYAKNIFAHPRRLLARKKFCGGEQMPPCSSFQSGLYHKKCTKMLNLQFLSNQMLKKRKFPRIKICAMETWNNSPDDFEGPPFSLLFQFLWWQKFYLKPARWSLSKFNIYKPRKLHQKADTVVVFYYFLS